MENNTKINIAELLENNIQEKLLKNEVPANVKSYTVDISKLNENTKNLTLELTQNIQPVVYGIGGWMHSKAVYASLSPSEKRWYIFCMCGYSAIIMLAILSWSSAVLRFFGME